MRVNDERTATRSLHWRELELKGVDILPSLLSWMEYSTSTPNCLKFEYFTSHVTVPVPFIRHSKNRRNIRTHSFHDSV